MASPQCLSQVNPDRPRAEFYRLAGARYHLVSAGEDGVFRSEAVPGFWLRLSWLWPAAGDPDPLAALRELGIV